MSHPKGTPSPGSGRRRIKETEPEALTERPELKATHASVIENTRWLMSSLLSGAIDPRVHAELQKDVEAVRKEVADLRADRRARAKIKRDDSEIEELRRMVVEGRERARRAVAAANGVAVDAPERTDSTPT